MFDKSQILKILGLCAFVFILTKALAPLLGETFWQMIFGSKKKKNSDIDFDALVTQKKAILRGGDGASGEVLSGSQSKKIGQTEEVIQKTYQELSKKSTRTPEEEKKFEDLKAMIKILDALQWGSLPEVEAIVKKLSQLYSHRFDSAKVNSHFKFLLQKNAFLDSSHQWQSVAKSLEILETYSVLKELIDATNLRDQLAKKWQMKRGPLEKAIVLKITPKQTSLEKLVKSQVITIAPLKDEALLSFLTLTPGILKNKNTLLNEFKNQAEIFHALSPLPPLKGKQDREGAFKSLGLSDKATIEQIKSRYKKLAQLKHPDTLKAKGIPPEFEPIATENFTQIKSAYDILIKG